MKIVINKCYGGFGLSDAAENLYMSKQGKEIFRYEQTKYEHRDGFNEYEKVTDRRSNICTAHTYLKDLGASFKKHPDDDSIYWYSGSLERNDPLLVEVVEELKGEASSELSSLVVTEIPDGVKYTIEEYDGQEWIAEEHRTW